MNQFIENPRENSLWNSFKFYFFSNQKPINNEIHLKIQFEEYTIIIMFMIGILITQIIFYFTGACTSQQLIQILVSMIALIFMLSLNITKLSFNLLSFLELWIYIHSESKLSVMSLMLINLPCFYFNSSYSMSLSIATLILNFFLHLHFIPKCKLELTLQQRFPYNSVNDSGLLDDFSINYLIESFIIIIIFTFLMKARLKTLIEIYNEKNELEKINQNLKNNELHLKKTLIQRENFIINSSHEARNAIKLMSGSLELAFLSNPEEEVKEQIENVKANYDQIANWMSNLMNLFKIEAKQLKAVFEIIEMPEFFEDLWCTVRILIQNKKLAYSMFVTKSMPDELKLDLALTKQVIHNLLSNALVFTKKGFVAIIFSWIPYEKFCDSSIVPTEDKIFRADLKALVQSRMQMRKLTRKHTNNLSEDNYNEPVIQSIRSNEIHNRETIYITEKYQKLDHITESLKRKQFQKSDQSLDYVGFLKIEVIDSGIGILQERHSKIFEKFNCLRSNEDNIGTGTSLWMSKQICEFLKGDLFVYSDIKEGTTFVAMIKCELKK